MCFFHFPRVAGVIVPMSSFAKTAMTLPRKAGVIVRASVPFRLCETFPRIYGGYRDYYFAFSNPELFSPRSGGYRDSYKTMMLVNDFPREAGVIVSLQMPPKPSRCFSRIYGVIVAPGYRL